MSERTKRSNLPRLAIVSACGAILTGTILIALLLPGIGIAKGPREVDIKVAFLFNFALYLHWPEESFVSADAPIVFGVLGDQEFLEVATASLSGRTANDRPVEIRGYSDVHESAGVHLLFIGRSAKSQEDEIRTVVGDSPVFMISDSDGFAARGGTANFYRDQGRVRFALNQPVALKQDLSISSKLLRLAKLVE